MQTSINRKAAIAALFVFLLGALSGAVGCYFFLHRNPLRNIVEMVLATFIPTESKEVALLTGVASGLETRSVATTRKILCGMIDIKVSRMKAALEKFSQPVSHDYKMYARDLYSPYIPSLTDMQKEAQCVTESVPNLTPGAIPKDGGSVQ